MISEEQLMAYADGELAREDRDAIEAALLDNEQAQGTLGDEWRLRRSLFALYDPALEEPVPERLTRLVEESGAASPRQANDGSPGRTWWRNVTAIAASLALGIFVGHGFAGDPASTGTGALRIADGEIARALDVQLASSQSLDAPVQVGISFRGEAGRPCRSFQSAGMVGLACREDRAWAMKLLAPIERSGPFEYSRAASASALIMKSAQELMAGEPMDAAEEREARDSGRAAAPGGAAAPSGAGDR